MKTKDNLADLQKEKSKLEEVHFVKAWKAFKKIPYEEQFAIRKIWDEYYLNVRGTTAYHIFQEQRKHLGIMRSYPNTPLAEESRKRIKDLAEDAKKMRLDGYQELPMPNYTDPFEIEFNPSVRRYIAIERKLNNLFQAEE